ncbi:MAG TPA: glycosyltransferase family A protein [Streptosporangiaceae bacterium]|nr:glycosyltransferase family A protein [Streptosporangiaceae bacterium]
MEPRPGPSAADTALTSLAERAREPAPLVTVITPAYNVAPYIGAAVDSVLGQRFRDLEFIVVDDGSTDETVEEVRRRTDPRLHLVLVPHGGSASARNAGLDRARGQFVAFLDGDDRWHPDFLERQLAALQSAGPDVAAVFARSRVISETGRLYAFRWQRAGRYDFDDMLVDSCPPRTGSSLLIRKSAFDAVGHFRDEHTVPDLDMWLRIQRDSGMPYFAGSAAYLLDLRVRSGAISRDHQRRFNKLAHLIAEYAPDLRRYPAGMAYVRAAVFAFRAGNDDVALPWARLARTVGLSRLLRYSYGWRLVGWSILPARGRVALRRSGSALRGLIGRAIKAPGGLLR